MDFYSTTPQEKHDQGQLANLFRRGRVPSKTLSSFLIFVVSIALTRIHNTVGRHSSVDIHQNLLVFANAIHGVVTKTLGVVPMLLVVQSNEYIAARDYSRQYSLFMVAKSIEGVGVGDAFVR